MRYSALALAAALVSILVACGNNQETQKPAAFKSPQSLASTSASSETLSPTKTANHPEPLGGSPTSPGGGGGGGGDAGTPPADAPPRDVAPTPPPDAPAAPPPIVANADPFTIDEDKTLTRNVLSNDSGGVGRLTAQPKTGPSHAKTFKLNPDGSFIYTPTDNYNGTDSFTYIATDGRTSSETTVTTTINPVNDPPVARDDGPYCLQWKLKPLTVPPRYVADYYEPPRGVLKNDSDVDGDELAVVRESFSRSIGPTSLIVDFLSDGSFKIVIGEFQSWTVPADVTLKLTHTVTDGKTNSSATVTITVKANCG